MKAEEALIKEGAIKLWITVTYGQITQLMRYMESLIVSNKTNNNNPITEAREEITRAFP